MKRTAIGIWIWTLLCGMAIAQPVKNVIVMIPDGCSTELLALGRWINGGIPLALDSRICGLVKTYCSDSPIGDSAPTGSTYATGHRSQDGFVATYPARSMRQDGQRYLTDSSLAYSPMFTLLEAAKLQGKATGMVVTCFFPHATPADFLAHTPSRKQYTRITKQMVHNPCDVLLGGGRDFIEQSFRAGYSAPDVLTGKGILYARDFPEAKKAVQNGQKKIWGLFAPQEMDYEIDRNPAEQPDLEQMTRLALEALSRNEKGFFLMVEGSKIDWGAHNNDLTAAVFDFLAFDRAVDAAMQFAEQDGQTLVIVVPDHQTGGLSLGNRRLNSGYASASAEELFAPIKNCKASAEKTVRNLLDACRTDTAAIAINLGIALQRDFGLSPVPDSVLWRLATVFIRHKTAKKSVQALTQVLNPHFYIGWTTYGHNGGDVFLAMYHPQGRGLTGVIDNESIAPFVCREAGLGNLDSLSRLYFAPVSSVFPDAVYHEMAYKAGERGEADDPLYLELTLRKGRKLKIFPNTDYMELNKKRIPLHGMCIYNGKGFYLPLQTAGLVR
ncbi:MAG: alkaline phosphatase [Bacteroidales bacterium]|nr:alkaline phosphatase [Bacteroidales bacterium]